MINWSPSLELNIKEIDEQHMKFLELVNQLIEAMKTGKSKSIQSEMLDNLISYAFYHFTKEERYLNKSDYPGTEQHKLEHEKFVDKIAQFKKDYDEDKITLSIEMMHFMTNWWTNHIRVSDKKYLPYVKDIVL